MFVHCILCYVRWLFPSFLGKLSCAWLANLATLTVDNWLTGELSTFHCCLEHISIRVCSTTFEAAFTDEFWKRSQHQSTCDWIAHKDVNTRCKLVHTQRLNWPRYSQIYELTLFYQDYFAELWSKQTWGLSFSDTLSHTSYTPVESSFMTQQQSSFDLIIKVPLVCVWWKKVLCHT